MTSADRVAELAHGQDGFAVLWEPYANRIEGDWVLYRSDKNKAEEVDRVYARCLKDVTVRLEVEGDQPLLTVV